MMRERERGAPGTDLTSARPGWMGKDGWLASLLLALAYPRSVGSQSCRFAPSRKPKLNAVQSQAADLEVLSKCFAQSNVLEAVERSLQKRRKGCDGDR